MPSYHSRPSSSHSCRLKEEPFIRMTRWSLRDPTIEQLGMMSICLTFIQNPIGHLNLNLTFFNHPTGLQFYKLPLSGLHTVVVLKTSRMRRSRTTATTQMEAPALVLAREMRFRTKARTTSTLTDSTW